MYVKRDIRELNKELKIDTVETLILKYIDNNDESEFVNFFTDTIGQFAKWGSYYVWKDDLPHFRLVLPEALTNAIDRNNEGIEGRIVEVRLKFGIFGGYVQIINEGDGFNYLDRIKKIQAGLPHKQINNGTGMRLFNTTPLRVSYHNQGREIVISTKQYNIEEVFKSTSEL